MSATLEGTAEALLARYRTMAAGLPGAKDARERAAALFREHGLPDAREEAWRFTNLRPLAGMVFRTAEAPDADARRLLATIPSIGSGPCVVVVNGRLSSALSRPPKGLEVTSFAEHPSLTRETDAPGRDPLLTLNTMFAEDGAVVTVPKTIDGGLLIVLHMGFGSADGTDAAAFHPRHHIRLERGAQLALVEMTVGEGVYLHNPVTDISVGESAKLVHLRIQNESLGAFHLAQVNARVERDGRYQGFTLTLGARLARAELHVTLAGPGADADLDAAQLLAGQQHADITTVVRHVSPHATSRQTVKNVLTGHSHAVFQGRISVVPEAQKTDAYQRNETLLLSPTAQVNSKPELEIFADDVKCSHGATVGALDQDQLFYLQSRGVPIAEARAMLVRGFFTGMLATIPVEAGRSLLEAAADGWWKSRQL